MQEAVLSGQLASFTLDTRADYGLVPFNASRGTDEGFISRRSVEELEDLQAQTDQIMDMDGYSSPHPRTLGPRTTTPTVEVIVDGETLTVPESVAADFASETIAREMQDHEIALARRRIPAMRDLMGEDLLAFQQSATEASMQTQEDAATFAASRVPAPPTGLELRLGYYRRPRGAAKKGMKWDHGHGKWVPEAVDLPNYVEPPKARKRRAEESFARGKIIACMGVVL